MYIQSQNSWSKHFYVGRIQKLPANLDRIITNWTFIVRPCSSFATSKMDFRCLLLLIIVLSKFPMPKRGITKLNEAALQLSNRALFPYLHILPHFNTSRAWCIDRTSCRSIQSVTIPVINKSDSRFAMAPAFYLTHYLSTDKNKTLTNFQKTSVFN